jgi:hypothetical protein
MHSTTRSRHPRMFGALPSLGLFTLIAIAIGASVVSSVTGAASPSQQCPAGTILNLRTHACDPVKSPTAATSAPVTNAPPPVVHLPASSENSNCPASSPCPANAATCQRNSAGCTTATPATCLPGHFGATCQACPGGASNSCSSHGSCNQGVSGNGACSCSSGFIGPACQFSNALTCNGHGSVNFNGSCTCETGYSGPSCK